MNDKDLTTVREQFGLALPAHYVLFMRHYPIELETTKLNLGWCQEPISERYILKSFEKILDLNQRVRAPGLQWLADGQGWPNRFFVIGDDQCGNFYCLDTQGDSTAVYFYDHELAQFSVEALNLEEFKLQMIQQTLDFNADR
jgi:hypothetical protein